jgi:succinyl-CoA synthetase alpha subunit
MSVLVDKSTRLVVEEITGSAGAFHTRQCMAYGMSRQKKSLRNAGKQEIISVYSCVAAFLRHVCFG